MWDIIFYEKPNGRCPVKEFLDDLSPKADLPFINRKLELLAKNGPALRRPHIAYLRDDVWELRVKRAVVNSGFFISILMDRRLLLRMDTIKRLTKLQIRKLIGQLNTVRII